MRSLNSDSKSPWTSPSSDYSVYEYDARTKLGMKFTIMLYWQGISVKNLKGDTPIVNIQKYRAIKCGKCADLLSQQTV